MAIALRRQGIEQVHHAIFHAANPEMVNDMGDQRGGALCHHVACCYGPLAAYCRETWAMLSWMAGSASWINVFSTDAAASGVSS